MSSKKIGVHGTDAETGRNKGEKTTKKCPITKEKFIEHAKPIHVKLNDTPLIASVKEFSTGSFGWNLNGKGVMVVDGVALEVQIGLNITVIGSKPGKE